MEKPNTIETQKSSQPEINIGIIGHVDHGKTTLLQALSGKWADTHSEEQKRGITIKLGYADVKIYNCKEHGKTTKKICPNCKIERTVSFVDAPGHETLMATMLSGAGIMDGAILLVAANEECPQPQTREHIMALEIMGLKNIIVVQNKIDLVTKEEALKNYKQIKDFLSNTIAKNAPIIPLSAIHNINTNYLAEAIEEFIPTPQRNISAEPIMFIARSFDVNKPGTKIKDLIGGVLGGAIQKGILKIGDKIEISPGRMVQQQNMEKWIPIKAEITGIRTGNSSVKEVHPGGSIAISTKLDPSITKSDQLAGNLVGFAGKLPKIWTELKIEPKLLGRIVGIKEESKVEPIKKTEALMLNVNAATTAGIVTNLEKNKVMIKLKHPFCAEEGSKLVISRRIDNRWKLIGTALVKN